MKLHDVQVLDRRIESSPLDKNGAKCEPRSASLTEADQKCKHGLFLLAAVPSTGRGLAVKCDRCRGNSVQSRPYLVQKIVRRPVEPLDYRLELALNDAILVDVLRSSPACVLDRASLASECLRRSMNINTFSLYLSYSPVILHLGTDVWSLRGVRVDPTAVAAVREANALRPRERRVLDHGWTPDGQLWLAARIPATHEAANLTVGIPSAIRHFLSGREFDARDEDNVSHGTIRVTNDGVSYGFKRFLRQRGADEGDILITEFDLVKNVAGLRLGDDELIDDMSPEN